MGAYCATVSIEFSNLIANKCAMSARRTLHQKHRLNRGFQGLVLMVCSKGKSMNENIFDIRGAQ